MGILLNEFWKKRIMYTVIRTTVGFALEYLCNWYVKKNPELFSESSDLKTDKSHQTKKLNPKNRLPKIIELIKKIRGGAFWIGVIGTLVKAGAGLFVGAVSGYVVSFLTDNRQVLRGTLENSLSKYRQPAVVVLVQCVREGMEEIQNVCDYNPVHLFRVLWDRTIPYEVMQDQS